MTIKGSEHKQKRLLNAPESISTTQVMQSKPPLGGNIESPIVKDKNILMINCKGGLLALLQPSPQTSQS